MVTLSETVVALPVRGGSAHWDYGTSVIPVPGTSGVLLSPPSAASRAPFAVVDLDAGDVAVGSGMPGYLRDAHFPPADSDDPRWWLLGLHGVGRLAPGGRTVEDVVRTGIGRYPRRLVPLDGSRMGIGTPLSPNIIVVPGGERTIRLRAPRAAVSVPLGDGRVRIFAPETGKALDVDTTLMKTVRRHEIPVGRGARIIDDVLVYLSGEAVPLRVLSSDETPTPGVPVVVGSGADVGAVVGGTVVARRLVGIGVTTLEPAAEIPPLGVGPDAVEVLGRDADGNLAISDGRGFGLVSPASTVLAHHQEPRGIVGAGMLPGRNVVALASRREPLGSLVVVRW